MVTNHGKKFKHSSFSVKRAKLQGVNLLRRTTRYAIPIGQLKPFRIKFTKLNRTLNLKMTKLSQISILKPTKIRIRGLVFEIADGEYLPGESC